MDEQEYTLEEISYSQKEDCRIMESVLSTWFQNPKTLNLVSPNLTYPFRFKDWISKNYSEKRGEIISITIKKEGWIIGHISYRIEKGKFHIFHLYIEKKNRNLGLAQKLMKEIEKRSLMNNINTLTLNVMKKNKEALKLYKKLGYKKVGDNKFKSIKMEKQNGRG